MNKESIKSIILTVLIGISLFFTWNMWNIQPPLDKFQNSTFFESVPIGDEKRSTSQVVKPLQLYIHTPDSHFSTLDEQYMNSLWNEMQKWKYSLSNNRNLTQTYTKEKFKSWIHGKDEAKIELRFYDEIPLETFDSIFQWDTDTTESIGFDRIYLNVPKEKEVQKVYFVSSEKMKIIEASVNLADANKYIAELYSKRSELQPYFAYGSGDGIEIMLPVNEVEIDSYQYFTDEIEGERFKDALFSNPRIVKQDFNHSKNRYTDSQRELNIYPNQHMVSFVNPALTETNSLEGHLLIDQSINYLNDHGGWTDDYVLYNIDEINQEIRYVMSIQSIPVIQSSEEPFGPTVIAQRWGQNEVAVYQRPSYQLETKIPTSNSSILMSGQEIVDILSADQSIDTSSIKNIFVIYELGGSTDQKYVRVTPSWCIEMDNGQMMIMNEEQGRDKSGVE